MLRNIFENFNNFTLELAELGARIGAVVEDVKEGGSLSANLQDSIDSANKIIGALTKDIEGLKKRAQKK